MKCRPTEFSVIRMVLYFVALGFLTGCASISSDKTYYKDYSMLVTETKDIMNYLGIRVRDSLEMDGKMVFSVIDLLTQPGLKDVDGQFARSKSGRTLDINGDAVKYAAPIIYLSKEVDSILTERKDRGKFMETYARSILVHELTHFLQKTVVITYNNRAPTLEAYLKSYPMKMKQFPSMLIIY